MLENQRELAGIASGVEVSSKLHVSPVLLFFFFFALLLSFSCTSFVVCRSTDYQLVLPSHSSLGYFETEDRSKITRSLDRNVVM